MSEVKAMTNYQKAQLLYLHLGGDFKYKNSKGNKVARQAWSKMIYALLNIGFIDEHARVTQAGVEYLNENHLDISLSVLD